MAPEDLEARLHELFSNATGEAFRLTHFHEETLECLEEVREEDELLGRSANEPFLSLTGGDNQSWFILTVFQRDTVSFHVGRGLPSSIPEKIVHSQRSEVNELESEILSLSASLSTLTFPRSLVELWLAR